MPSVNPEKCDQQHEENNGEKGDVNIKTVGRQLTSIEMDACQNCVVSSKHSQIHVMPNHAINKEGELEGFSFLCSPEDVASIMPISKSLFYTTAVYECFATSSSPYLQLMQDLHSSENKLRDFVNMVAQEAQAPVKLDCMQEDSVDSWKIKDEREWTEELPSKIGIYHCFMRTNVQNMREHKVFIVVSGACKHAAEEVYNLWLDARHTITSKQFLECAEINWLRKTTSRHHNRLAARLADFFNFKVHFMKDIEAVGPSRKIILPTLSNVCYDLSLCRNRIVVTNNAAILNECKSGVIFDCWGTEGFWIFSGPRDTSAYKIFGSEFLSHSVHSSFPTSTVRYHSQYISKHKNDVIQVQRLHEDDDSFNTAKSTVRHTQKIIYNSSVKKYEAFLFPNTQFLEELNKLGFRQNDGIINLMPIVAYCEDE